jgi:transcriptional antiterminator NusG
MQYVRGLVDGEKDIELKEIEHYLAPKPIVADITEGDIVEIINGPFKGEKARVRQIDTSKEEITVELFEAMKPGRVITAWPSPLGSAANSGLAA